MILQSRRKFKNEARLRCKTTFLHQKCSKYLCQYIHLRFRFPSSESQFKLIQATPSEIKPEKSSMRNRRPNVFLLDSVARHKSVSTRVLTLARTYNDLLCMLTSRKNVVSNQVCFHLKTIRFLKINARMCEDPNLTNDRHITKFIGQKKQNKKITKSTKTECLYQGPTHQSSFPTHQSALTWQTRN